jgi:DNA-binding transcriptional MerR regulator
MTEQLRRLAMYPDQPRLNIKAVMQQTGVHVSTLRVWEQRYGFPAPQRSAQGHRLYSERDVELIRWLREQVDQGMAISRAIELVRESRHPTTAPAAVQPSTAPTAPGDARLAAARTSLLAALLSLDIRQAHLITSTLTTLFPVDVLLAELFQPILADIGERWMLGTLSVAEEHMISAFVRQRLLALFETRAPFARGPRAVCLCVPGERHELGMLMFALLLQQRGWEVLYLGQNVALAGSAPFFVRSAPALVVASVTLAEHLPGLIELARIVEPLQDHGLMLAYSGRIFEIHPELRRRMPGAYLGATLHEGVQYAQTLAEQLGANRVG